MVRAWSFIVIVLMTLIGALGCFEPDHSLSQPAQPFAATAGMT